MKKLLLICGVIVCLLVAVGASLHAVAWYCVQQAGGRSYSAADMARKYAYLHRAQLCEPDNPRIYYEIGRMYEELRAKPYLAQEIRDLPGKDRDLKRVCLDLAARNYEKARDRDPKNALYQCALGRAYLDMPVQEDESARERAGVAFEEAVKLDPANPLYHYWMGVFYHMSGLVSGAISKYREAIDRDKSFGPRALRAAWNIDRYPLCLQKIAEGHEDLETMLAGFLMAQRAFAAAKAACIAVCQHADDYSQEHQVELLRQLIGLKQSALAKLYALEWLENRKSVPLELMLASALELGGDRGLAIKKMEEITRGSPAKADYHSRLADLYRNAGRFEDAVKEYDEAISLEPQNGDRYEALGRLHWARKDFAAVIDVYKRLTNALPRNALGYYQLGNGYLALDDLDRAIEAFRESVRLAPEDKRLTDALAATCARKAQRENAGKRPPSGQKKP